MSIGNSVRPNRTRTQDNYIIFEHNTEKEAQDNAHYLEEARPEVRGTEVWIESYWAGEVLIKHTLNR